MQKPYAPFEDNRIFAMLGEGKTYQEIGDELGRSRDSVRSRWRKLAKRPEESNISNVAMRGSWMNRLVGKIRRFFRRK
jgi:DNA-binding NarL/FixJ family response regulator